MDVAFFAEMAWKSALIAGAALMLAYALRSRAAADRALVLRIGVTMLLLLPLIAVMLPALPIEAWAAPVAQAPAYYLPGPEIQLPQISAAALQPVPPSIWDDPTPLVLLAYVGGLLMVGGRLLAGLWLLRRWTRDARDVACPDWLAAFERTRWEAPNGDRIRLMVSDTVRSPLSWGLIRPVILIDPDTLARGGEAEAILAHEIAHIARRDWLALMLTRIAAALFWFNPMVWLLEREIVQQAEEAADCVAARCVEPARYAQTLLSWAQVPGRALPANSIAPRGSALGRRVRAILDRQIRERPTGSALTRIAVMLCVAIAAPVAAMKLVQASAPAAPEAPIAPVAPLAPHAPHAPAVPGAPPAPPTPPMPVADLGDLSDIGPAVDQALAEVLPQIPVIVASAMSAVDPEEIEREVDEALRESRHEMSRADRERLRSDVRRSVEQARSHAMRARAHGARAQAEAVRAVAAARPQIAAAQAQARRAIAAARPRIELAMREAQRAARMGMANGADGMARGADGMERGARQMEETARRLRTDSAYRERQIALARARGETVTHEQLIEAAQSMQEGAQGMREGAREMREGAERMRRGHGG
jgi:beta-lactamase regulating signal transducer with metallopeptidase domain